MSDYDDELMGDTDQSERREENESIRDHLGLGRWREKFTEVGTDVRDFSRSNPGAILVGALALGALLGFSLRGKRDQR
ncbi:MAG: hypothetical protein ABI718_06880 [Acidobacteriota bacterium]